MLFREETMRRCSAGHGPGVRGGGRTWVVALMTAVIMMTAGCLENTDPDNPPDPPDAITVTFSTPRVMVRPDHPATVELDLLAPQDFSGGIDYGIDFAEAESLISIDTASCGANRPTCERWTIRARDAAQTRAESYSIPILTSPNFTPSGTAPEAYLEVYALPRAAPRAGVVAVDASESRAHARLADGSVWSWGTSAGTSNFGGVPAPTRETLPAPAIDVAAGDRGSFAVLADGTLWWWGMDAGTLAGADASTAGRAVAEVPASAVAVDIYDEAVALVLTADGALRELHFDRDINDVRPLGGLPPIAALAAAPAFDLSDIGHLALDRNGLVWRWAPAAETPAPAQIAGLPPIAQVVRGERHALALDRDGSVWAFGANDGGQLGDGTLTDRETPVPVVFPPGAPPAVHVAAARFTSAAVLADGSVWTWGRDDGLGALGRGGSAPGRASVPEPVPGLTRVMAVEGGAYGYFLAIRDTCGGSGAVLTWGELLGGLDADGVGGKPMGPYNTRPVALQSFGDTAACDEYEVTVYPLGTGGGRIVSDSGAVDCGEHCTVFGAPDALVTLTAIPDEDSEFVGWDWDCAGGAATATVQLSRNMDCLAYFRGPASGEVAVSVLPSPDVGRVTSDPAALDCGSECSRVFGAGTTVTLTPRPAANPVAAALYAFSGWSGDADCDDGVIQVDGDTNCSASFERIEGRYELAVEIRGDGRVASLDAGNGEILSIDCTGPTTRCAGVYAAGTDLRLELQPAPGFEVVNAFGACDLPGEMPVAEATVTSDAVCTIVFGSAGEADRAVAVIVVEDTMPVANQTITLDGAGSYVLSPASGAQFPDLIDFWEWDFEDDGTIDVAGTVGSADRVSHAWPNPGRYDVFLRVTGRSSQDGGTVEAATRLTISVGEAPLPPGPGTGTVTLTVDVDAARSFVRTTDGRIDCPGVCSADYPPGSEVTLVAENGPGEGIGGWTGDCASFGQSTGFKLTLESDVFCGAFFR
jgi:hypothetical protein